MGSNIPASSSHVRTRLPALGFPQDGGNGLQILAIGEPFLFLVTQQVFVSCNQDGGDYVLSAK
jgi:hypothetical protein